MLSRRTLLAGAVALAALAPLQALAASWVTLGTKTVNLLVDHDTIWVGAGSGVFTSLRIKVTGNTVFFNSLHVTFSNGQSVDVPVRLAFLPGTWSRNINLPGIARHIRRIDMLYSKLPLGGTAVVTVQGYKL